MAQRRLFLALMPGPRVQGELQQHMRRWHWPAGLKTVAPQRLHLTLHFLGDVGAADEAALLEALPGVPMKPIQLQLAAAEVWKNGVAVLRPRHNAALLDLHQRLARLPGVAAAPQPAWKPHVTLARKAGQALPPEAPPPIQWTARRYFLVHSELGANPQYHLLWASSR